MEEKGGSAMTAPDMTRCIPKKRLAPEMICPSWCPLFSHTALKRLSTEKEESGPTGAEWVDGVQEDNVCDLRMSHNAKSKSHGQHVSCFCLEHTTPILEWKRWQKWSRWQKAGPLPPTSRTALGSQFISAPGSRMGEPQGPACFM